MKSMKPVLTTITVAIDGNYAPGQIIKTITFPKGAWVLYIWQSAVGSDDAGESFLPYLDDGSVFDMIKVNDFMTLGSGRTNAITIKGYGLDWAKGSAEDLWGFPDKKYPTKTLTLITTGTSGGVFKRTLKIVYLACPTI